MQSIKITFLACVLLICPSCQESGVDHKSAATQIEANLALFPNLNCDKNSVFRWDDQFALSPDGKHLVVRVNVQKRYLANNTWHTGFQEYHIYKLGNLIGIHPVLVAKFKSHNGYGQHYEWHESGSIVFINNNTNNTSSLLDLDTYYISEEKNLTQKFLLRKIAGELTNSYATFDGAIRSVPYEGWRQNIYGEANLRVNVTPTSTKKTIEKETNVYEIQINTHGTDSLAPHRLIKSHRDFFGKQPDIVIEHTYKSIGYYTQSQYLHIFPSDYFRSAENRIAVELDNDRRISHFFYLTNQDREHVALYRYDDRLGRGTHTEVFAPKNQDVISVSLSRDGSQVYFASTDKDEYYFFDEDKKDMIDLIRTKGSNRLQILSENNESNRSIVKQETSNNNTSYTLVDTSKGTAILLGECSLNDPISPRIP